MEQACLLCLQGQGLPAGANPVKVTYMQGQKTALLQIFPPEYVCGYEIFFSLECSNILHLNI